MDTLLLFFLGIVLVFVFIQDLKNRLIHISLLVILLLITLIYWYTNSFNFIPLLYNFSFVFVNLICLKLYTIFTKKEKTEDLIYGLGLGDILFLIVITPLFSTANFIFFFITGLFISMLTHIVVSLFHQNKFIPLAGYLSLYLICFVFYLKITNKGFYLDLISINY